MSAAARLSGFARQSGARLSDFARQGGARVSGFARRSGIARLGAIGRVARSPAARVGFRLAFALAGVLAITALYVFLATGGRMTKFPHIGGGRYEQLAVAFADGHSDLIQRPDPTKTSEELRCDEYWDLSLHHGRFYVYWGPVPALLDAAYLRWFGAAIPDDPLTVVFAVARAVLGAWLLVRVKQRFFAGHPWWPTAMGIVTLVIGAPLTLIFSRPAVYEAAIIAGQAFLVAATCAAFVALTRQRGPGTRWLLALAGTCLGLAIGSRLTLFPAALAILGLTVLEAAPDTPRGRRRERARVFLLDLAAMSAPIGAALVALGLYDRARFGSVFDTGILYQITQRTFHVGARFIAPNLYALVARAPHFEGKFPFVFLAGWNGCPLWKLWPDLTLHLGDYDFEAAAGFLWTTPFYAFAFVAWLALARWVARSFRRGGLVPSAPAPRLAWLAAVSLALAAGVAPTLISGGSATRYLADATAGLSLAATLGLSLLIASPARSRFARWALAALAGAAVVFSLVINLAFWVEGPYGAFLYSVNRPLFESLSAWFPKHDAG